MLLGYFHTNANGLLSALDPYFFISSASSFSSRSVLSMKFPLNFWILSTQYFLVVLAFSEITFTIFYFV